MALYEDMLARWQASLPAQIPGAAVAQFLAEEGPALRQQFEFAAQAAREHKSTRAFQRWLDQQARAGHEFDEAQLRWLDSMRQDIAASGELTLERLGEAPYRERGGHDKAVQLFGRRTLTNVVASMNATFAGPAVACGCGCSSGARGGCGCKKNKAAKPPQDPRPRPGYAYVWDKDEPFEESTHAILRDHDIETARYLYTLSAEGSLFWVWELEDGRHAAQTAIGVQAAAANPPPSRTAAEVLKSAGLELLEGSLYHIGALTLYRPKDDGTRARALEALTSAGFRVRTHNGQIVLRERARWS